MRGVRLATPAVVAAIALGCGARSSLSLQGDSDGSVSAAPDAPGTVTCGSLDEGCRRFDCASWRDFGNPPCSLSLGDPIFEGSCGAHRTLTFDGGSSTTYIYDGGGSLIGIRSIGVVSIDGTTGSVCFGDVGGTCLVSSTNLCAGVGAP